MFLCSVFLTTIVVIFLIKKQVYIGNIIIKHFYVVVQIVLQLLSS
jgi:hypothetical protein